MMKRTEFTMALYKLTNFLDIVIDKYYTDCESSAAELLTWIEEEAMRRGNGRLGFYAVVAIADVCWNVWSDDSRAEVDHLKLIQNILNIIRRNDVEFLFISDIELFEIQFSNFAEE